jgi:hypothetical protein
LWARRRTHLPWFVTGAIIGDIQDGGITTRMMAVVPLPLALASPLALSWAVH